ASGPLVVRGAAAGTRPRLVRGSAAQGTHLAHRPRTAAPASLPSRLKAGQAAADDVHRLKALVSHLITLRSSRARDNDFVYSNFIPGPATAACFRHGRNRKPDNRPHDCDAARAVARAGRG